MRNGSAKSRSQIRLDVEGSWSRHESRDRCSSDCPCSRAQIQAVSQRSAGQTGFDVSKVPNRALRSRVLLAPASRVRKGVISEIQSRVLARKIPAEHGKRPANRSGAGPARLACADDLGMRDESKGRARTAATSAFWLGRELRA